MTILFRDRETDTPTFRVTNAISEEFANNLIKQFKDKTEVAAHDSGGKLSKESELRDSSVAWFHNQDLYNRMSDFMNVANYHMGLRYKIVGSEAFQFTKYTKNQHYTWHRDGSQDHLAARNYTFGKPQNLTETSFAPLVGSVRKISASLLLNDKFKGGEMEFMWLDQGEVIKKSIKTNPLDLIIFPSALEHRVAPVTSGTRYSVVIWYAGPPLR